MLAWKAGALSALATPVNATAPYSAHSGLFVATSAASATVTTIWTTCMTIRKRIRLKRSASKPPTSDNNSIGLSCTKISSPTRAADSVRSSMYAGSVKFCIHVPTNDSAMPTNTMRKSRYTSAALIVPGAYRRS